MQKINFKEVLMKSAAVSAGAAGAGMLNKVSFVQTKSPMIRGLIKIALGALVPSFLGKGKKNAFIEHAGDGAIAVGALELANATVFKTAPISINGIGDMDTLGEMPASYIVDENVRGFADEPLSGTEYDEV